MATAFWKLAAADAVRAFVDAKLAGQPDQAAGEAAAGDWPWQLQGAASTSIVADVLDAGQRALGLRGRARAAGAVDGPVRQCAAAACRQVPLALHRQARRAERTGRHAPAGVTHALAAFCVASQTHIGASETVCWPFATFAATLAASCGRAVPPGFIACAVLPGQASHAVPLIDA